MGRQTSFAILLAVIALLGAAYGQTALYGASDYFPGSSLSARWTVMDGGITVNNGTASGTTASWNAMRRKDFRCSTGAESDCNQSSQITLVNPGPGSWSGLVLRASGSGSYYRAFTDGTNTYIDTAADLLLQHRSDIAWVAGDTMTFRVKGATLELLRNHTVVARVVDDTLPTGTPGVMTYGTTAQLSAWHGMEIGAGPTGAQLLAARSRINSPDCNNCSLTTEAFDGTEANHIAIVGYSHPSALLACSDSEGNSYTQVKGSPWDNDVVDFITRTYLFEKVNPTVAPSMTVTCTQSGGPQGLAIWVFATAGAAVNNGTGFRAYAMAANPTFLTSFTAPAVHAMENDLVISDYQTTAGVLAAINAKPPYLSLSNGDDDTYDQIAYYYATEPASTSATYTSSLPLRGVGLTFSIASARAAVLSSLTLEPKMLAGGSASTGTIRVTGQVPASGAVVALSNSNPAVATVPDTVTVAAGGNNTATFPISTSPVTSSTSAIISATYNGKTVRTKLHITPALTGLSLNPASVVGNHSATGRVTLSGPISGIPVEVSLSSSNPAIAKVPARVRVDNKESSESFEIDTNAVAVPTAVSILASYSGATASATLTVTPAVLTSLEIDPAAVVGPRSSKGVVTLNGPAPSGGAAVALLSNNTSLAAVPPVITIPAGSDSASFSIKTSAVTVSTSATITASYGGVSKSGTLTVTPSLSALSVSPTTVGGGRRSLGTVTLAGPAPAGGAIVSLSDNSPNAKVPSSIMVPEGSSSASFTVSTSNTDKDVTVAVSASYGGTTETATLTITR